MDIFYPSVETCVVGTQNIYLIEIDNWGVVGVGRGAKGDSHFWPLNS